MLESTQTFNGLLEERFYLKTTFPQKKSEVVLFEHVSRNTLSITSTLNLETTKKTDITLWMKRQKEYRWILHYL